MCQGYLTRDDDDEDDHANDDAGDDDNDEDDNDDDDDDEAQLAGIAKGGIMVLLEQLPCALHKHCP